MDHNSWSSNNYPIRWFITIVWYGFFCCLWCPVDGLSKEGLIFLRLPVWHNVTSPSDPCFSSHSVLSPQCHFTLKELTIQGHHFAEETSAWAREAASLTNQPTGIAREQVRVRRFISFYFLQFFFFFFPFHPLFCSSLTNTPYPGKLPLLLPFPACHIWFQCANLALRLQGSFRQVSL